MSNEAIINEALNSTPFHTEISDSVAVYSFIVRTSLVTVTVDRRSTRSTYDVQPIPRSL